MKIFASSFHNNSATLSAVTSENHPTPWRPYWIEATLAVVLIVGPAVWLAAGTGAEHGNVADWVAATATVVAVIAAFYAGSIAKRAFKIEESREESRLFIEQTEQASKVVAWVQDVTVNTNPRILLAGQTPPPSVLPTVRGLIVQIRNLSQLPVHDVTIQGHIVVTGLPPAELLAGPLKIQVLPPTEDKEASEFLKLKRLSMSGLEAVPLHPGQQVAGLISMRFRDARGVYWERTPHGALKRSGYVPQDVSFLNPHLGDQ